jgi:hypothetical protein
MIKPINNNLLIQGKKKRKQTTTIDFFKFQRTKIHTSKNIITTINRSHQSNLYFPSSSTIVSKVMKMVSNSMKVLIIHQKRRRKGKILLHMVVTANNLEILMIFRKQLCIQVHLHTKRLEMNGINWSGRIPDNKLLHLLFSSKQIHNLSTVTGILTLSSLCKARMNTGSNSMKKFRKSLSNSRLIREYWKSNFKGWKKNAQS